MNTKTKNYLILIIISLCFSFASDVWALDHDFTGLPLTSDGWTDIEALVQPDSRIIYVSSSGDDSTGTYYDPTDASLTGGYSVLEPNQTTLKPYRSLAAGYAQLRDGYPDFLLLKRGESWPDEGLNDWSKSGRSQTERMVFGAYGSESIDRPKIGLQLALRKAVSNIVLSSLELSDKNRSLNVEATVNHLLIEDVYSPPTISGLSRGSASGMVIQDINDTNSLDWLALRRCIVAGRYRQEGIDGYNQGLFIGSGHRNLLLEENIFDDNGHSYDGAITGGDLRAHNTYITLDPNAAEATYNIFRGNQSSRASSDGLMAGSGGDVIANLSVQDPIAIAFGKADLGYHGPGGKIKYNVVLHGIDINEEDKRGWGISVGNTNGLLIEDNIIAGNYESGGSFGMRLMARNRLGEQMYIRNVSINNNIIYDWTGATTGGQGIVTYSDAYEEGSVYPFGSDTDVYVQDISITNNEIYMPGADSMTILSDHASDIVNISGNLYYNGAVESEWFRMAGIYYDLEGFKSQYGDTTSQAGHHPPSGGYGITDYLGSIGAMANLENYYTKLRQQRRGKWDENYMALPIINFVRAKFGRDAVTYSYSFSAGSDDYRFDVDNSGSVDISDALLVFRKSLGLNMNGTAWQAGSATGDVDCSGSVKSSDSLLLMRRSLGLDMSGTGWCE